MIGAALGESCGLTYDADTGDPPVEGDFIVSSGGSAYFVLTARKVRSEKWPVRYALRCARVRATDIPEDAKVHPLYWYRRDRRRP